MKGLPSVRGAAYSDICEDFEQRMGNPQWKGFPQFAATVELIRASFAGGGQHALADQQSEIDELHRQLGLLTAERDWLNKRCEIFNSDQGCQFTSPRFTTPLLAHGIQISMDGRGRALDNIFVELLWRTVKYDYVYLQDSSTLQDARSGLAYFKVVASPTKNLLTGISGAGPSKP